ncbi:MAG TPA: hypothetical protein VFB15_00040 [Candidatus Binataceae bacterium]|jgi:hypothetical protein|nr:hypothetical protein [Candidatus Binataceae bacterium]
MNCFHCGSAVEVIERVGFRDRCARCDGPLHVCLNCEFYDLRYNNQCRETQAPRVVDKDRANLCDYFAPSKRALRTPPAAADARTKLEALFKKKA